MPDPADLSVLEDPTLVERLSNPYRSRDWRQLERIYNGVRYQDKEYVYLVVSDGEKAAKELTRPGGGGRR